jgi:5-methylcytosine-specific restriction endonuclease McrA
MRAVTNERRRVPKEAGWIDHRKLPKGTFGRALCRKCGDEVPYPRKSFCSDECVHEWKIRTQPTYAAKEVLKRDAGVCALCRRDCLLLKKELWALRAQERKARWGLKQAVDHGMPSDRQLDAFVQRCRELGLPESLWHLDRRLWEMDHTLPVVEGGGSCGLENLRTLCWACHRAVTNELRARRKGALKARVKRSVRSTRA